MPHLACVILFVVFRLWCVWSFESDFSGFLLLCCPTPSPPPRAEGVLPPKEPFWSGNEYGFFTILRYGYGFYRARVKMGLDFRGEVCKSVLENCVLWSEIRQMLGGTPPMTTTKLFEDHPSGLLHPTCIYSLNTIQNNETKIHLQSLLSWEFCMPRLSTTIPNPTCPK